MMLKTRNNEEVALEPELVRSRDDYERGNPIPRVMRSLGISSHGVWRDSNSLAFPRRRFFVRSFTNGTSAIIEEMEPDRVISESKRLELDKC